MARRATPNRQTTIAIMVDLSNRIADLCYENGREDLAETAYLLVDLAHASPDTLRSKRAELVENRNRDDEILRFTAELMKAQKRKKPRLISTNLP